MNEPIDGISSEEGPTSPPHTSGSSSASPSLGMSLADELSQALQGDRQSINAVIHSEPEPTVSVNKDTLKNMGEILEMIRKILALQKECYEQQILNRNIERERLLYQNENLRLRQQSLGLLPSSSNYVESSSIAPSMYATPTHFAPNSACAVHTTTIVSHAATSSTISTGSYLTNGMGPTYAMSSNTQHVPPNPVVRSNSATHHLTTVQPIPAVLPSSTAQPNPFVLPNPYFLPNPVAQQIPAFLPNPVVPPSSAAPPNPIAQPNRVAPPNPADLPSPVALPNPAMQPFPGYAAQPGPPYVLPTPAYVQENQYYILPNPPHPGYAVQSGPSYVLPNPNYVQANQPYIPPNPVRSLYLPQPTIDSRISDNRRTHELPQFNGRAEEWPLFASSYYATTEAFGYSKLENLLRIQKSLKGDAKTAVESLLIYPSHVEQVMETLEFAFG